MGPRFPVLVCCAVADPRGTAEAPLAVSLQHELVRILFSGTGLVGHLVPMFPLMRAALASGHEVGLLTGRGVRDFVERENLPGPTVIEAGPPVLDAMADMARRTGRSPATKPDPDVIAEFFAGELVDTAFGEASVGATDWGPDVVISEAMDHVGPMVAAALEIPLYRHTYGPTRAPAVTTALTVVAADRALALGLTTAPVRAWIDVYPAALQEPGRSPLGTRWPMRPEAHRRGEGGATSASTTAGTNVLVSFGTVFTDPGIREAVVQSFEGLDANLVVTVGTDRLAVPDVGRRDRTYVGFRPIAELLEDTDVVVTAGGAGTVLATLSAGVPMVVLPLGADHRENAGHAMAAGVAVLVDRPEDAGPAALAIATDPAMRTRATAIAAEIRTMPSPERVLQQIVADMRRQERGGGRS